MNLEISTLNVMIGATVALQCWIVRELIGLKVRIARIETRLGIADEI